jgi:aminoglycoside phosphotransferase (APT) family kinase protein
MSPVAQLPGRRPDRSVTEITIHAAGGTRRPGFEKRYASSVRAEQVYRRWRQLEAVDFGAGAGVPELTGWDPGRAAIRSLAADGVTLDTLSDEALSDGAAAAAEWLAALHRSDLALERRLDLAAELRNAGRWAAEVAAAIPRLGRLAQTLHERLCQLATSVRPAPPVPLHKDFHPHHVLVGNRLVVLDFDEMRLGDPAFDVAHFCMYLRLGALRRHGALEASAAVERRFRDQYSAATGWTPGQQVPLFTGYTCLKLGKQLIRGTGVPPHPTGGEAAHELRELLSDGLACVGGAG